MAAELVAWGKVAVIEARGRRTGRMYSTPVGFIDEPEGTLLVAASDWRTDWALNLMADPHCRVAIGNVSGSYLAEPLDGPALAATVTALILRYGTPAERLGAGPAFRLRPHAETA
ncbi:MAG: nitroreductase family deazaflavin-dependent oxidoreductase [Chloroflexi bacterium]|nr:nitroreductase family deazaflavin-dependent oxidoreductase [Chloroflexota bacterium]